MRPILLGLALLFTASAALAQTPTPANPPTTTPTIPTTAAPAEASPPQVAPRPAIPAAPAPAAPAPATTSTPTPTNAAAPPACPACEEAATAYWVAFGVITGFLAVASLGILSSLRGTFSLAEALTEKTTLRTSERATTASGGATGPRIVTNEEPGPSASSASRLIAMIGTLILAAILLGVGYGMIWSLFTKGQIPALAGIGPYLMGGAALFAPYAFNQLKEAFK